MSRPLLVQVYRLGFLIKRQTTRFYLPAKDRFLIVFTNRYAIHFAIIAIAAVVSTVNFSGNEVRAENFGEHSTLYALVSGDDSLVVEEVSAEEIRDPEPLSYLGEGLIVSDPFIDHGYVDGPYAPTVIGGGTLVSPTLQEADESVAPRTEVEIYDVQSGDTVSSIAAAFGISTSTVLWANDLGSWSYIRPGDELKIPPVSGVLHTVKNGDTLNSIASEYEVESEQIIAFNKLASADDLVIGEEIIVPGGKKKVVVPPRRTDIGTPSSPSAPSSPSSAGSAAGDGGWVWPADWRVITQYFGWRHTGLDIDGDYHTNNYAAKAGVVTYAGWLGGYGLMVEIDHGGGVKTRYAHFSSIGVSVGQRVSAGQYLGKCGTTGRSTGTHLHFEVIVNGRYQNPLSYIR